MAPSRSGTHNAVDLQRRQSPPEIFCEAAVMCLAKVAYLAWAELTLAENHRYRAAQQERPSEEPAGKVVWCEY